MHGISVQTVKLPRGAQDDVARRTPFRERERRGAVPIVDHDDRLGQPLRDALGCRVAPLRGDFVLEGF